MNNYAGAYFAGAGLLQEERANARRYINHGNWAEGISLSDPGAASVEYSIIGSTGVNDRGIFCTDTSSRPSR